MKKSDILELTRLGVRQKLHQVERYLATVFDEFPDEFATPTPPVFVRPTEKAGGNSWPAFVASDGDSNGNEPPTVSKHAASWTPERRAQAAARMKKVQKKQGPLRKDGPRADVPWGTYHFQQIHDFLLRESQHMASLARIAKTLKIKDSSVLSAMKQHPELFKRIGPGAYQLTAVPANQRRRSKTKPTKHATRSSSVKGKRNGPPVKWGTFVWQRMHDYLAEQPEMTARLSDMLTPVKIASAASGITGIESHQDLFVRVKPGYYQLKKVLTDEEKLSA